MAEINQECDFFSLIKPGSNGLEIQVIARDTFVKNGVLMIGEWPEKGDRILTYDAELIDILIQKGIVSKIIGEPLIEGLLEIENMEKQYQQFIDGHPNLSKLEKWEALLRIKARNPELVRKNDASISYLFSIENLVNEERCAMKSRPLFKKNIDPLREFGLTKPVMDRFVYLPELLEKAKLFPLEDSNQYLIKAELSPTSSTGQIGLEYYLIAPDHAAAEKALKIYKNEMDKHALKILLGFWKMANQRGMFDYVAGTAEIMSHTADPGRTSYFSVKEKERFWALAKLLENTKLTLKIPYKQKGQRKGKILTIEHRLIEISAREDQPDGVSNNYPNKIKVRVLDPQSFEEKANIATAIANGTLRLPPEDILLALTIQTRASQRRKEKEIRFNEEHLIKRGHLQRTSQSNPRMARQRLREKLDRVKNEADAIEGWDEKDGVYRIRHNGAKTDSDRLP